MNFTDAIKTCLRKYVTFSGRASRSEYWWFFLFCFGAGIAAQMTEGIINAATGTPDGPRLISSAFNIATFLPSLAVGWRRMHDTGRSGLFLLYPFIALIGIMTFAGFVGVVGFDGGAPNFESFDGITGMILFVAVIILVISPFIVIWWLTRPSQPHPNEYGPVPTEVMS